MPPSAIIGLPVLNWDRSDKKEKRGLRDLQGGRHFFRWMDRPLVEVAKKR